MKYNIIGDTHTRTKWKHLVREDCVNVFVGDYFAFYPHEFDLQPSFADQKKVLDEIFDFKISHPETVLLLGNHDTEHWQLIGLDKSNRYDRYNCQKIKAAFEEHPDFFQMAVSLGNRALVTHAGVSAMWYGNYIGGGYCDLIDFNSMRYLKEYDESKTAEEMFDIYIAKNEWKRDSVALTDNENVYAWHDGMYRYNPETQKLVMLEMTPDDVADAINAYWNEAHYSAFAFQSRHWEGYGDDPANSPIWVRPTSLRNSNIFKGRPFWQIVGHTQFTQPAMLCEGGKFKGMIETREKGEELKPDMTDRLVFVDCLGQRAASVIYDTETDEMTVNDPFGNVKNS